MFRFRFVFPADLRQPAEPVLRIRLTAGSDLATLLSDPTATDGALVSRRASVDGADVFSRVGTIS